MSLVRGSEQHRQTRPLLSGLLRWVICISAGADSGFSLGWHQQCCGFDCNLVTWLAYAPYPSHLLFSSQNLHEHNSVENSNLCQMQQAWPKGSEVSSCEKRKGKTAKKEWEGCTLYEHKSSLGNQARQEPVTVHARQGVKAEMGKN